MLACYYAARVRWCVRVRFSCMRCVLEEHFSNRHCKTQLKTLLPLLHARVLVLLDIMAFKLELRSELSSTSDAGIYITG